MPGRSKSSHQLHSLWYLEIELAGKQSSLQEPWNGMRPFALVGVMLVQYWVKGVAEVLGAFRICGW